MSASFNLQSFNIDLAAFAAQLDINLATVIRKITFDLWGRIVQRTPVDTGRARAGWVVSVGTIEIPAIPPGEYGPPAAPDLSAIGEDVQIVYILNNVEYVEALENGHSQQAPAGMIKVSIAEMEVEIQSMIL